MARMNGIGRSVIGAAMVVAPGLISRLWLGSGDALESKVLARTHGIRDIALGAGLVWAVEQDEPLHAWLASAALCDAVDAGVTVAFWDSLPRAGRVMVFALAAGAAVQTGVLAARTAR